MNLLAKREMQSRLNICAKTVQGAGSCLLVLLSKVLVFPLSIPSNSLWLVRRAYQENCCFHGRALSRQVRELVAELLQSSGGAEATMEESSAACVTDPSVLSAFHEASTGQSSSEKVSGDEKRRGAVSIIDSS